MRYFTIHCIITVFITTLFIQCKDSSSNHKTGIELMKYGIPYTLAAPKDVKIAKIGSGRLADVSVKNEQGYDVQIFMSDAFSNDMTKLKSLKKVEVTSNPYFSKIVEEYDDGFLYEKINESNERSFDFMIIKVQGDKELTFQCGNSREFTENDVKKIVASIQK